MLTIVEEKFCTMFLNIALALQSITVLGVIGYQVDSNSYYPHGYEEVYQASKLPGLQEYHGYNSKVNKRQGTGISPSQAALIGLVNR